MKLSASDFYSLFNSAACPSRVYLRSQGAKEAPASPCELLIQELGRKHELAHLAELEGVVDLSQGTMQERAVRTLEAIQNKAAVLYQPVFQKQHALDGQAVEIVGIPDFMILQEGGYVVRDAKIARRIDGSDRPEIALALGLYGWLFEQIVGVAPAGLEVLAGSGKIETVPYDGGTAALDQLKAIVTIRKGTTKPYSPVGWSKCKGCGFFKHCWESAEANSDVSMVVGVDQGLAYKLNSMGIETVEQLLDSFDEPSLSLVKRPWGNREQKVGKKAAEILRMARAMATGKEEVVGLPLIPSAEHYVMFDLEGLPPLYDDMERVYLWGMRVYGADGQHGKFLGVTSGFGEDGDRDGWEAFLEDADKIMAEYGDIPWVHFAPYEKVKIGLYINRYGDRDGIAARVLRNLVDLLPAIKNTLALPVPSYGLKVLEKYFGFERTQDEFGGDWSIVKYLQAVETEDLALRQEIMDEILLYNFEDLEATWHVLLAFLERMIPVFDNMALAA